MKLNSLRPWLSSALVLSAAALSLVLSGCGVAASTPDNSVTPVTLQGQVFAGRNYMANATVKIYETQSTGVATNGTYVGKAKLLTTLTANTTGGWSVQGLSCTSPNQLYVTAEAGVPYPWSMTSTTLINNPNSLMMTAIGDCSLLTSASSTRNITTVVTNEASTVAAVWALRPFISLDGTTVNVTSSATNYAGTDGVGTTSSFAGLVHAFANANNLSPYGVGNFVQYTGQTNSATTGGLVPVQELNSLAYAQYLCTLGSTTANDASYALCQQLYALATPPSGTAPTNSLQAMLNIATYPANNAAAILTFTLTPIPFSSQTTSQVINSGVYVPALTSLGTLTSDWSVAIYYLPGYGATTTGQSSIYPINVALDANDDVFFSNPNASVGVQGNIIALSSSGSSLWTSDTDSTLTQPSQLQVDALGNLWVANGGSSSSTSFVQQMDAASGEQLNRYSSSALTPSVLSVDQLGNIWYGTQTTSGQNVFELQRSGTSFTAATLNPAPSFTYSPSQIRADQSGNLWVATNLYTLTGTVTTYPGAMGFLANTGTASAPTYTSAAQSVSFSADSAAAGVTIDGSGNAYTVASGTGSGVFELTPVSSTSGVTISSSSVSSNPAALAELMDTDGAGNIWYLDHTTGTDIYRYSPADGSLSSYYPCYNAGTTSTQTCTTGISTRNDFAIDSTGSMWVASYGNSGGGRMVQVLGLAAPTVPLRALGKPGVMP